MTPEQEYISHEPRQYTTKEKFSNWFYYYKWWLLIALILLYIIGSMIWNKLGIGRSAPDYRFAYVGSRFLPKQCAEILERQLACLGEDVNGDGVVKVEIRQYVTGDMTDPENLTYGYASEIKLMVDISEGESYFFLLEDPEAFQLNYQVLTHLDGSIPDDSDFSITDKVLCWGDCPVLSGLELGDFEAADMNQAVAGSYQEWLSSLYFGRRFFSDESSVKNREEQEELWRILTEGAPDA